MLITDRYGGGDCGSYEPLPLSILLCAGGISIDHRPLDGRPPNDQPIPFGRLLILVSDGQITQILFNPLHGTRIFHQCNPGDPRLLGTPLQVIPLTIPTSVRGLIHHADHHHTIDARKTPSWESLRRRIGAMGNTVLSLFAYPPPEAHLSLTKPLNFPPTIPMEEAT